MCATQVVLSNAAKQATSGMHYACRDFSQCPPLVTGFQQALGSHLVIDADYFYKHTNNAYDFNVLFNTSVTFPISWQLSKLDGVSARINFTNYKGLSAFMVAGHTRARFFPPESGGLFFNSDLPTGVFRIDHDQAFQQTTQVQYQFERWKRIAPYLAFTWRYDSGLVSGAVPDFATALTFTADHQAQIGLFCGSTFATSTQAITTCNDTNRGALRVRIPADGTENDDHNPPRITPRHLFDFSAGTDNLFGTDGTKVTLRFTVLNLTNKEALYNFQSTFSGTHFVSPACIPGSNRFDLLIDEAEALKLQNRERELVLCARRPEEVDDLHSIVGRGDCKWR